MLLLVLLFKKYFWGALQRLQSLFSRGLYSCEYLNLFPRTFLKVEFLPLHLGKFEFLPLCHRKRITCSRIYWFTLGKKTHTIWISSLKEINIFGCMKFCIFSPMTWGKKFKPNVLPQIIIWSIHTFSTCILCILQLGNYYLDLSAPRWRIYKLHPHIVNLGKYDFVPLGRWGRKSTLIHILNNVQKWFILGPYDGGTYILNWIKYNVKGNINVISQWSRLRVLA